MLEKNTKLDVKIVDNALIEAAKSGYLDIVKLLVNNQNPTPTPLGINAAFKEVYIKNFNEGANGKPPIARVLMGTGKVPLPGYVGNNKKAAFFSGLVILALAIVIPALVVPNISMLLLGGIGLALFAYTLIGTFYFDQKKQERQAHADFMLLDMPTSSAASNTELPSLKNASNPGVKNSTSAASPTAVPSNNSVAVDTSSNSLPSAVVGTSSNSLPSAVVGTSSNSLPSAVVGTSSNSLPSASQEILTARAAVMKELTSYHRAKKSLSSSSFASDPDGHSEISGKLPDLRWGNPSFATQLPSPTVSHPGSQATSKQASVVENLGTTPPQPRG